MSGEIVLQATAVGYMSPGHGARRTKAIRRWQRVRTLIKNHKKKKRIFTQIASPSAHANRSATPNTSNPLLHLSKRRQAASEGKLLVDRHSTKQQLIQQETPLRRFRRIARLLQILVRVSKSIIRSSHENHKPELHSIGALNADMDGNGTLSNSGLVFDPTYFKARREGQLSMDVKRILTKYPSERSSEEIHSALVALKNAVQSFGEFPIKMQQSLAMVGWYESFEAKRVIIRQGHKAESFYLILSGTSGVTISSPDPETSEPNIRTVAFLKRGNSFGELALMHHATRAATVYCKDSVELLSIDREDFTDIFMHRSDGAEPEFIRYLRSIEELKGWPVYRLPYDNHNVCLFTYFRRGIVICKDSNKSEWIYIIKTGTCRVLKKLKAPKRLFKARVNLMNVFELPSAKGRKRASSSKANNAYCPINEERSFRFNADFRRASKYTKLPSISPEDRLKGSALSSPSMDIPMSAGRVTVDKVQEHINLLQDKISSMHFESNPTRLGTSTDKAIFIQVQKLSARDTFGLKPLVFCETEGAPNVTLVSEGAECVLISKRFFLTHLSEEQKKLLRGMLRPYPNDTMLQEKLQEQTDWDEFKCHTMQGLISKHIDNNRPFLKYTA